jgi:hypothetical protein
MGSMSKGGANKNLVGLNFYIYIYIVSLYARECKIKVDKSFMELIKFI